MSSAIATSACGLVKDNSLATALDNATFFPGLDEDGRIEGQA
jgi:hypothetical protein